MKAIVRDGVIIDPPQTWNPRYYAGKILSYGFSVSFPIAEPVGVMVFGDVQMLPVENIYPTPFDSGKEEYTGPTIEIFKEKVVQIYGKKDKPPVSPEPDPLVVEAQNIVRNPDAVEAINAVLKRVYILAQMGVNPDEWTFQSVIAASEVVKSTDLTIRVTLLENLAALQAEWLRVIFHAGSVNKADELWPYFFDAVSKL